MKRQFKLMIVAALLFTASQARSQSSDTNMFNHLSVAFSTGTDGLIGFDVASPIGNYVQVRAGYQFMPKFKATVDVDYTRNNTSYTSEAEGKLNIGNFKLLFDAYPFKKSSFHVTAGAYIGSSKILEAYNKGPLAGIANDEYGVAAIQIDDNPEHFFMTDPNGNIKGRASVNGFKPYLGIGFGRQVSEKRVNVSFDLGLQFWGTPKLEIYNYKAVRLPSDKEWVEITKNDFNDHDGDTYKALKNIEKITVYPVLNLRIGFRAF